MLDLPQWVLLVVNETERIIEHDVGLSPIHDLCPALAGPNLSPVANASFPYLCLELDPTSPTLFPSLFLAPDRRIVWPLWASTSEDRGIDRRAIRCS